MFKELSEDEKTALNLFLAFVLMGAVFEPDFGSWIRHESVTIPLFLIVFGLKDKKTPMDAAAVNLRSDRKASKCPPSKKISSIKTSSS
jgi:hypothetical protein